MINENEEDEEKCLYHRWKRVRLGGAPGEPVEYETLCDDCGEIKMDDNERQSPGSEE